MICNYCGQAILGNKRTSPQNRFYWLVVNSITAQLNEMGNDLTPNDIHELNKWRILRKTLVINNRPYQSTGSTTKLDTKEFGEFLDKVMLMWIEFGLTLPDYQEFLIRQ